MTEYALSAPELAALFGISARRVGQYRDDGLLPTITRGRFDAGWLHHLRTGEKITQSVRLRLGRDVLVAIGWLSCLDSREPEAEDLEAFARLFERNGLTRNEALLALGRAQQQMAS